MLLRWPVGLLQSDLLRGTMLGEAPEGLPTPFVLEKWRSPVFSRGFQPLQTQPKLGSAETHLRVWLPSSMIWNLRKDLCLVLRDGSS